MDCLVIDPRAHFSSTRLPIGPDAVLLCKEKSMSRIKPSLFSVRKSKGIPGCSVPALAQDSVAVPKQFRETTHSKNITLKTQTHTHAGIFILNTSMHFVHRAMPAWNLKCESFLLNQPRQSCFWYVHCVQMLVTGFLLPRSKRSPTLSFNSNTR